MTSPPATRRVGILGDPDDVLWDGTALRESDSVRAPRYVLRRAGLEVVRGAGPDEVVGVVVLVDAPDSPALGWSLVFARRRGFDRVVVLRWPDVEEDVGDVLRAAGFDPSACPIVDAVLEGEGDPAWGTQFDVLDARSAKALVAALRSVCLERAPPARAPSERTAALLATIEDAAVVRLALPVQRGQLTDRQAWRAVVLEGGRIGRTLVDAAPYVEKADGAWPNCATCGHAMTTVFQVDPADGPDAARFSGLYVVFACCAPGQLSSVIRYYRAPHVAQRRTLAPPPTDRAGGRLGYLLARGRREIVPRTWSALPGAVRDALGASLDGMAGAELYEVLAEIVAARQASDASAGGGIDAPVCEVCRGACSLVFSTTYLAGGEHAYELWACPCTPERARLSLREIDPLAPG